MNIAAQFRSHPISKLDLSHYTQVESGTTVRATIAEMNDEATQCALVTNNGALAGIFTDRDALLRVVTEPESWDEPISEVMTADPYTTQESDTAVAPLALMNRYRLRNVPVLTDDGRLAGNVTHFALMGLAHELLCDPTTRDDHELAAQHSMLFVEFTGLMMAKPITVTADTSLADAIHQMRARSIGSVVVVDGRGALSGIFTETDAQARVACQVEDLDSTTVGECMTVDPVALSARDPISAGFREMAAGRFGHLPLVSATARPVGVVSFRDLADYMETSFAAMA